MYLALSQEYLRLELAYLINFEQRRLFLGIRDKKDFVDKAVWTCSVILFLFIFFVIMKMLTESSCTSYNELCIAQAPRSAQHKRTIFSHDQHVLSNLRHRHRR